MEYAVALMEAADPSNHDQISSELKAYVALSERDHAGLPSNMPLIYDYLTSSGDSKWYLPPQWYAAQLTNNPGFTTTVPDAVIRKATMLEGPPPPSAPSPAMAAVAAPAPHARTKPAAAHVKKATEK
jgi:hypothetical protein